MGESSSCTLKNESGAQNEPIRRESAVDKDERRDANDRNANQVGPGRPGSVRGPIGTMTR